jgi:hypothetical protein
MAICYDYEIANAMKATATETGHVDLISLIHYSVDGLILITSLKLSESLVDVGIQTVITLELGGENYN